MANGDPYVKAVEAVYASGVESDHVPDAFSATNGLFGASGATLEVIDKAARRPTQFFLGRPAVRGGHAVFRAFCRAQSAPRTVLRQRVGEVNRDYQLLDERAMTRDAFYSGFLPNLGLRYFLSAVLRQTPTDLRPSRFSAHGAKVT
jgi:hypothetical protein